MIQEWRKTCCEICGLILYVLHNELLQKWQEGSMTVAYVFIKALIKLEVGRVIIIWYQAYWRHNIIEHSSLKVNSARRWTYVWTALHSSVADNDWSNIPHLSLQEKNFENNGTVHQLFTSFKYADNSTVHSLQKRLKRLNFSNSETGTIPRTTVLL